MKLATEQTATEDIGTGTGPLYSPPVKLTSLLHSESFGF